jgi:hypothetical protein
MISLAEKALGAKRESKSVDFKQCFDCESKGDWCEVIKDLVAMANSGGGIVVFGLGNTGEPVGFDCTRLAALDPADVANKIGPYIGSSNFAFSIVDLQKGGCDLVAFLVEPAATPYVFERPGSYTDPLGKPKSAFALGTTYFRHNAKSEPGTNEDLRKIISRQVEQIRKELLKDLRKVVEAPAGSKIIVSDISAGGTSIASAVRLGHEPSATVVRLTRSKEGVAGTLMHEEISDALLDEINNVLAMNRLLFPGQNRFLLGSQIYYRVYAERQHVQHSDAEVTQLLYAGIADYSPFLFWCSSLSDRVIAEHLADIVLWPKGNEVNSLIRLTPLLGTDFRAWLDSKFTKKWGTYSQPPAFYWRVKNIKAGTAPDESRLLASRLSLQTQADLGNTTAKPIREIISDEPALHAIVSKACIEVFRGNKAYRSIARDYDYLAHGNVILERASGIAELTKELVGDHLPNDEDETTQEAG